MKYGNRGTRDEVQQTVVNCESRSEAGNRGTRDEVQQTVVDCGNRSEAGNRGTRDEVQQIVVDRSNRSELSYSNKLHCKLSTNLAAKKRIFAKEQV